MTYEVKKDFKDDEFGVDLHAGEEFIPAAIGYPQNRTDARVFDGSLVLVTAVAPHGTIADGDTAAPKNQSTPVVPEH